jgi:hypothetical protein
MLSAALCSLGASLAIEHYTHAVVWNGAGSRLRIEAAQGCASRPDAPVELQDVRVTLETPGAAPVVMTAPWGMVTPRMDRFLLGAHYGPLPKSRLSNAYPVTFELKRGIVRSPGGVYLDLKSSRPGVRP